MTYQALSIAYFSQCSQNPVSCYPQLKSEASVGPALTLYKDFESCLIWKYRLASFIFFNVADILKKKLESYNYKF